MSLRRFILFFILYSHLGVNCFAQKNFSEGYVVFFNGDTVFGKINDHRSGYTFNAKPIKIKFINKNGEEVTYHANKIKGYCKAGIINYLSINDRDEGPFFSKILITGPITLLSTLVNNNQDSYTRYFLLHKDKKFTYEVTAFEFKRDMAEYFSDYSELQQLLINKELRYNDIEIIVRKYNEWYVSK